ncbi:MAG: sigma-70 family RNA polymerase sigma factor [SAR202 cluster bacterium]|nr:sigma-70 family RNA polymerase sigma factor [SAR202 cluster bacterium]
MKDKLDENFIKSLRVIARGIARGKLDPDELVNGAVEYLISNKEKYMDHPNVKAVAVLKMKGLFIDEIRKTKKFTSMTDKEGRDMEIADEKQTDISDKINLSSECNKVLSVIKSMGEKCREILMLAADDLTYKEIAEKIDTPIGTVMSRLANCRKELKGLMV